MCNSFDATDLWDFRVCLGNTTREGKKSFDRKGRDGAGVEDLIRGKELLLLACGREFVGCLCRRRTNSQDVVRGGRFGVAEVVDCKEVGAYVRPPTPPPYSLPPSALRTERGIA